MPTHNRHKRTPLKQFGYRGVKPYHVKTPINNAKQALFMGVFCFVCSALSLPHQRYITFKGFLCAIGKGNGSIIHIYTQLLRFTLILAVPAGG